MASVDWGKLHGAGEVKAQFRHSEKEQRMEHEHANKQIDKDRTGGNYSMYGLSYGEMCGRYDKKIGELDAGGCTNKRKDRVTCFCLEIPAPEGLPEDKAQAWFSRVHGIITSFAGEGNVIDGIVHVDEIHEYTDASTGRKRMSRAHLHEFVIPEVDGSLNGKRFSSKANINRLNREIHEMSLGEFGVRFMDGTKKKSKKSVEELKQESATEKAAQEIVSLAYADIAADIEAGRMLDLQEHDEQLAQFAQEAHEQLRKELETTKAEELEKFEKKLDRRTKMANALIKQANEKESEVAGREERVGERERAAGQREKRVLKREIAAAQREADVKAREDALQMVKPDEDMSRKRFMESMKFKDGTTLEELYQRKIKEKNQRTEKAKLNPIELAELNAREASSKSDGKTWQMGD